MERLGTRELRCALQAIDAAAACADDVDGYLRAVAAALRPLVPVDASVGVAAPTAADGGRTVVLPVRAARDAGCALVLRRRRGRFDARERALLDAIGGPLAALLRLALARDDRARAVPRDGAALTRREHEVLEWLRAGKTNRDIAAILGASPRTVEKHLEHVYVKLGVETRTAAAMRAARAPAPAR